ncbi:MAG: hypothetical protein EHM78_25985 [Myxococcaceae bacterium]|nr:MAG: hypothetical protein EHM78_25985 [Myxococcaceae bacterium]
MSTRRKLIPLAVLLVLLVGPAARAEIPPTLVAVSYQFSIPIGETYNFTPPVSWRGIGLDVATFIRKDLAVGLAFGWNVFHTNVTSTINIRGTDITGNQDRTLNIWPTLANARWFPKISSNRDIQPFIGANVGGYIIERYFAVGLTSSTETHYHFGLAPEIGVFFQNPVGAVLLSARYNMAFAAGGVPFQQFLTINLGYAWER